MATFPGMDNEDLCPCRWSIARSSARVFRQLQSHHETVELGIRDAEVTSDEVVSYIIRPDSEVCYFLAFPRMFIEETDEQIIVFYVPAYVISCDENNVIIDADFNIIMIWVVGG